jgi:hypothetical protein
MLVAETSGSYELAPVGVYSAVCVRLINMGMQETSYGLKHQVHLAFEIDEKMEDGRPFLMMQNYTMSLNERRACGLISRLGAVGRSAPRN